MPSARPRRQRDSEPPRRRRSLARFLAPLALIGIIVVLVVIISGATGSSTTTTTTDPFARTAGHASSTQAPATRASKHKRRTKQHRSPTVTNATGAGTGTTTTTGASSTGTTTAGTYTIASGDTFASVSEQTGVAITRIEKLNPSVSSSALTVGQVLKLK